MRLSDIRCVNCGNVLANDGSAYISGGACVDYTLFDEDRWHEEADKNFESKLSGFLHIGFHSNPDIFSVDHVIVDDEQFGQFTIPFCSLKCLKEYLTKIIDELEKQYQNNLLSLSYD